MSSPISPFFCVEIRLNFQLRPTDPANHRGSYTTACIQKIFLTIIGDLCTSSDVMNSQRDWSIYDNISHF